MANINIGGRLHSTATGNTVAGANEILDDSKGKKQSVINQETDAALAGKQDTIPDLATIRSGAAAGATAYQKPSGGIPKTDLASGVQTSLGKADTAYQKPSGGIPKTDMTSGVQGSLDLADSALQYTPSGEIDPTITPAEYATREEMEQLQQEVDENAGNAILAKPIATINGGDVNYQLSHDINQTTGVALSGGYRAAVLSFLPIYGKLYISVASGFAFNILWYSAANEASFLRSTQYTQLATFTPPDGTKYFRMVFQRQGNSSAVTESFDTIVTALSTDSLYEKVRDIAINCVRTDSQNLTNEKKKQAVANIGAMPYRAVSFQNCSASASSVNKDVLVDLLPAPTISIRLTVKMSNANTADDATMSVNGGTAYPLFFNGKRVSSTNTWENNAIIDVIFDGSLFIAFPFSGVVNEEGGSSSNAISQYAFTIQKAETEEWKIRREMSIGKPLVINGFTTWKPGSTDNPSATNRASLNKRIPVVPGHRYAIVVSRYYSQNIAGFRPEFSSTRDSAIYYSSWLYHYYDTFTVPKNREYLLISITKQSGEVMTTDDAENCNITLIDVTGAESLAENGSKISNITSTPTSYTQALAVYKGVIFQGFSNGILNVYSTAGEQITTVELPTIDGEILHTNVMSWGDYYSSSDEFPLLIVSANDWGKKIGVFRITRNENEFSITTIYEITTPSAPTGYTTATQFVDVANKRMVVACFDSNSNISLFVYGWTDTFDDNTTFSLVSKNDTGLWFYGVQDGILVDNLFYFLFGVAGAHSMLVAYNTDSEELVRFTDLRRKVFGTIRDEEPEGIGFSEGLVYFSTTKGIYKASL